MNTTKHLTGFLISFISFNNIHAQVPVYEEPFHKQVLKNEYIRLIDVHLNPGDTTQFHIHAAKSVFIHFTTSTIGGQLMGEAFTPPGEVAAGYLRYTDYEKEPITHKVYNADNNVFHVMDIELMKKEPVADVCTALQQSNVVTAIKEKLVRVYKFDLKENLSLNVPKSNCAHLLTCISGEVNTAGKNIPEGKYMFFDPGTDIHITNLQNNNSTCVLLELE